jgi:hypothetical protein
MIVTCVVDDDAVKLNVSGSHTAGFGVPDPEVRVLVEPPAVTWTLPKPRTEYVGC